MPPEERRAAIIAAVRPLLLSHGARFTTREVAEAAGIAEGTIFRVFASKQELLHAVISSVLDPTDICASIDRIDRSLDLEETVVAIVRAIEHAVGETTAIFSALHAMPADDLPLEPKPHDHGKDAQSRRSALLDAAIVRALAPHADQVSIDLPEAASLLRSATLAAFHPFFSDGRLNEPAHLGHLLVHGIAKERPC